MNGPHEPVYLRFRGHMRRLPLMSVATTFHRDLDLTSRALEILLHGPPESRSLDPPLPEPRLDSDPGSADLSPPRGEGGKGGGERSNENVNVPTRYLSNVQRERFDERSRPVKEGSIPHADAIVLELARALGDERNFAALRKLTAAHPQPLLHEALRRTLAVPPERVRGTRGALFTGIVRRLARDGWTRPEP